MRLKNGYSCFPVYCVGSNFNVTEDNRITPRRPKKEDIEYYQIFEPDGSEYMRCLTIQECKEEVANAIT